MADEKSYEQYPKFLYSKAVKGALSQGEFIIKTTPPRCIGKIIREEKVRVEILKRWDEMDDTQAERISADMTNWFFFSYVKKAQTPEN